MFLERYLGDYLKNQLKGFAGIFFIHDEVKSSRNGNSSIVFPGVDITIPFGYHHNTDPTQRIFGISIIMIYTFSILLSPSVSIIIIVCLITIHG